MAKKGKSNCYAKGGKVTGGSKEGLNDAMEVHAFREMAKGKKPTPAKKMEAKLAMKQKSPKPKK